MTDKLRDAEREAFEHALASKPDARFWNTADAMFWAWQARAALAHQDAQNAADEVWRKLFWQAALKLKCLPSSYPDANGHVLRAIDRLMGSENAQQDAQAVPQGWRVERVSDDDVRVYGPDAETWLLRANPGKGTFEDFAHRFCFALASCPQPSSDAQAVPQWANAAFTEIAGCFDAEIAEGLLDALAETRDERLKNLVVRRLMYAHAVAAQAAAPTPPAQQDAQAVVQDEIVAAWKSGMTVQYFVTIGHDDEWTDYTNPTPPDTSGTRLAWRVKPGQRSNAAPTPPAQRVMLTDEEISRIYTEQTGAAIEDSPWALNDFVRAAIEAYERKNGKEAP